MKKKVKKTPKYEKGTPSVKPYVDKFSFSNSIGEYWNNMDSSAQASAIAGGIGGIGNMISNATSGKDVTFGGVVSGIGAGAATGAQIGGPWGAIIGGAVGGLTSAAGRTNGVNYASRSTNINDIMKKGSGILGEFGMSDAEMRQKANLVQNSNIGEIQTQLIRAEYAMNPNNPNGGAVMAAEGGIMRRPVDALVSKGELIYDPTTKKLRQVPGSKGKPNKADDVFARLYEGDVVISNSPTMLMANGKTPALNLMGMVDKYATGGTVKAREAIIKKVVNWLEANKTQPQEYAKFDGGGIAGVNKYGYNKNMSDFAYWDKDKNEYKKKYLDWVNTLTEQDVRDIEAEKYGDMSEYFSKNKGKKLDVATAQKLMTDKKYGNWHKIGQAFVDTKRANAKPLLPNLYDFGERHYLRGRLDKPITKLADVASVTPTSLTKTKITAPSVTKTAPVKEKGESNWLDEMSNLLPVIGGLFDKYDWHTESSQITPPLFVPVNADPRPLLRAADESLAMARYNQTNISPNTGAGMAYGLQAASNRAKAYADAYQWQQETNNKLIAQNAGIYNDWRKQRDAYATQAIADTRANEGAAQQMEDQARKDRLEFYYGKRNDSMLTAMLKPMFEYGTPDEAYKPVYRRRIV